MRNFHATLLDVSFNNLDLIVNLNSFISTVVDVLLHRIEVALEMSDCLVLVTESLFMISLASANLSFKGSNTSLQLCDHILQTLKVTLKYRCILYLLAITANNAVSCVTFNWSRLNDYCCFSVVGDSTHMLTHWAVLNDFILAALKCRSCLSFINRWAGVSGDTAWRCLLLTTTTSDYELGSVGRFSITSKGTTFPLTIIVAFKLRSWLIVLSEPRRKFLHFIRFIAYLIAFDFVFDVISWSDWDFFVLSHSLRPGLVIFRAVNAHLNVLSLNWTAFLRATQNIFFDYWSSIAASWLWLLGWHATYFLTITKWCFWIKFNDYKLIIS